MTTGTFWILLGTLISLGTWVIFVVSVIEDARVSWKRRRDLEEFWSLVFFLWMSLGMWSLGRLWGPW